MPVDYAEPTRRAPKKRRRSNATGQRKATPRRSEGPKVSVGFAYLSGLCSGLAIVALVWLLPKLEIPTATGSPEWLSAPDAGNDEAAGGSGEVLEDLRFYEELPSRKVWVPVVDEYEPAGAEATAHPHFLLQAGSFRAREDADRLRAKLLLLGLDAKIHRVELSPGVRWHRVLVGPYDDAANMRKALTRLREAQIDPIPLRQG